MNRRRLEKLRRRAEELRKKGGIGSSELESLAEALGYVQSKRGKHLTWVNQDIPNLPPLSIHPHGSSDLNKFTKNAILDQLEFAMDKLEEFIE